MSAEQPGSGFAHITLATRSVERSAEFFAAALGWSPIDRPSNIGCPAAWLRIAPGQELHLIEVRDFAVSEFEKEFGRHLAVTFPGSEFDALKSRLLQGGAELIPPERPTPFERFFFRDPNGYLFEVIEAGHEPET